MVNFRCCSAVGFADVTPSKLWINDVSKVRRVFFFSTSTTLDFQWQNSFFELVQGHVSGYLSIHVRLHQAPWPAFWSWTFSLPLLRKFRGVNIPEAAGHRCWSRPHRWGSRWVTQHQKLPTLNSQIRRDDFSVLWMVGWWDGRVFFGVCLWARVWDDGDDG